MYVMVNITNIKVWIIPTKMSKYICGTIGIITGAKLYSRAKIISDPSIFPKRRKDSETGCANSLIMFKGNINGSGSKKPYI